MKTSNHAYINYEKVTKYGAVFFSIFLKYFVELMQVKGSNVIFPYTLTFARSLWIR